MMVDTPSLVASPAPVGQVATPAAPAAPVAVTTPSAAPVDGQAAVAPVTPVVPNTPVTPVVPNTPGNVTNLAPKEPTPTPVDFMSSLKPENKASVEKAGFKTLDAVIESYNALRAEMVTKGINELPADATKEQRDAWNKARGRPDTAAEYALAMPTEMPKDMPYDQNFAEKFKAWAHETGLTKAQANELHSKYVASMAAEFSNAGQKAIAAVTTAQAELTKAWGEQQTPAFARNVEMATRAMRHLDPGLSDALKAAKLLGPDGTVLSAPIAKALANAGNRLYAEDQLFGSSTSSISNPWEKGKENLSQQGEIFKADPDRARRLAQAAGKKVTF